MQSKTVRSVLSLALLPGFFLLASCGGDSDKKEGSCDTSQAAVTTASYDQLWTNVFSTQCLTCHGVDTNSKTIGGPDLRTKDAFHAALVGKKGSDYINADPPWQTFASLRSACANNFFIEASSASTSMVVAVLDPATSISGCTIQSHVQAGSEQNICITSGNLAKLKEWINAGASK